MDHSDLKIFMGLFREACRKCFGHDLVKPLSETESKQLSTTIFDKTGLVIGVKSIKNYSQFVIGSGRQENPSIATLDTLARYVLDAPVIDEVQRKDHESHHPYWFEYKRKHLPSTSQTSEVASDESRPKTSVIKIIFMTLTAIIVTAMIFYSIQRKSPVRFVEDFIVIDDNILIERGWRVILKDNKFWQKRSVNKGHLTLYTLRGDNWSDSANNASISNLLVREIDPTCFSAEIHFTKFVPQHNWQQAGILLLEDTLLSSKGVRMSIAYNDFFGGYNQPPEILIQAISSLESDGFQKPEEFAHIPVFKIDSIQRELIINNMSNSALRIERTGQTFRFLYSTGSMANAAFKEAAIRDLKISPRYIGIFAIQGFVDQDAMPVLIDKFILSPIDCR